jgi:methylamine dehydrogenase light chain
MSARHGDVAAHVDRHLRESCRRQALRISYNDCCGKSSCGRCLCNRNDGDKPVYRPQSNNDINWCMGTKSTVYNCSTAVILGTATTSN